VGGKIQRTFLVRKERLVPAEDGRSWMRRKPSKSMQARVLRTGGGGEKETDSFTRGKNNRREEIQDQTSTTRLRYGKKKEVRKKGAKNTVPEEKGGKGSSWVKMPSEKKTQQPYRKKKGAHDAKNGRRWFLGWEGIERKSKKKKKKEKKQQKKGHPQGREGTGSWAAPKEGGEENLPAKKRVDLPASEKRNWKPCRNRRIINHNNP